MIFSLLYRPLLPAASLGCTLRLTQIQTKYHVLQRLTGGSSRKFLCPFVTFPLRHLSVAKCLQNEEDAAAAAKLVDTAAPTIFDKILKKEIPATIVYEDDLVLAFRDINPQAPVHVILIPKIRDKLTQISKAEPSHKEILGHLMYTTGVIAKQEGIGDNFRVVINNGPGASDFAY